jgi:hypothetical protein
LANAVLALSAEPREVSSWEISTISIPACESEHRLTDVDEIELGSISAWLENAPFDRRGDFEQCSDNAGLLQHRWLDLK